jgi:hypothetical protein
MRSIGLPCCVDFCPFWATSSGRHYWNVTFDRNKRPVPFAGTGKNFNVLTLPREVGKAYRVTYQKQPDALASIAPPREIPPGYFRSPYLKDVTSEYGDVADVKVSADFLLDRDNIRYAFAAVFNYSKWGIVAWTPIKKEGNESSASFRNMQRGCVYLSMSYYKGKTQSLSHPFSIDSAGTIEHLAPDTLHKRDITLYQQDGYLIYRPGKKYTLFYWDEQWKEVATKVNYIQNIFR